ncbi:MAG: hypothetical protein HQ548_07965 [Chloroflexi bacterium]|nr:hypothetical protein [Chloroflexota bacterium]
MISVFPSTRIVRAACFAIGVAALTTVAGSGCSSGQPAGADIVLIEMVDAVKLGAIPERWDLINKAGWGAALVIFGSVEEEVEGSGTYEISFPPYPDQAPGIETWRFDRVTLQLQPLNPGALLTATYLFCESARDPALHCVHYFREIERLKQTLK